MALHDRRHERFTVYALNAAAGCSEGSFGGGLLATSQDKGPVEQCRGRAAVGGA